MTDQEILTKAIEKAIAGGWFDVAGLNGFTIWSPVNAYDTLIILEERESHEKRQYNYQAVIFNHDFAKALWGETKPLENGEYPPEVIMYKGKPMWHPWKHHLQNMVIADDPIAYLAENM